MPNIRDLPSVIATCKARLADPVAVVFFCSLILSLISTQGRLINRDGIYYLEMTRAILDKGQHADISLGSGTSFLPMLLAALSFVTRIDPEYCAYILNAFFLAGTCALVVAWVRLRSAEVAWAACLVVLAMPAYNQYRNEILREYGFWFFSMLGFWLAMQWKEARSRKLALYSQLSIAVAALFRMEAVIFFPALMLWQAWSAPPREKLRAAMTIGILPLAGLLVGGLLYWGGVADLPMRLAYYLDASNPLMAAEKISSAATRMLAAIFDNAYTAKYSREEGAYILFFGLLSVIPVKFINMCGLLVVPLAYRLANRGNWLERWQPLPWMGLAYLMVLVAFVTHQFFLVGRYVSMINLLAVPVIASGLALMMQRFPRWKILMVVTALVMIAANVLSLSPRKTHVLDAGNWLSANVVASSKVGVSSGRIAYYAGWRSTTFQPVEWENAQAVLATRKIDLAVLEVPKHLDADQWLRDSGLSELQRFRNKVGETVIVVSRPEHEEASRR